MHAIKYALREVEQGILPYMALATLWLKCYNMENATEEKRMEHLLPLLYVIIILYPIIRSIRRKKREDEFFRRQKETILEALREYDAEKEGK